MIRKHLGITYGLAGQTGQPWVQSYIPAGSTSPVYVLHDQQGTPPGYVQAGKSYAWVTDNIGSVFLIGTSGTSGTNGSVAGFNYDPYGHITGTQFGSVPENLIRYAGGLADPTTGYTHFGQRWYNPATGAFTTQDSNSYLGNPANGNRYAYAASNPAN
jgi:RHS repeat-associated protein